MILLVIATANAALVAVGIDAAPYPGNFNFMAVVQSTAALRALHAHIAQMCARTTEAGWPVY